MLDGGEEGGGGTRPSTGLEIGAVDSDDHPVADVTDRGASSLGGVGAVLTRRHLGGYTPWRRVGVLEIYALHVYVLLLRMVSARV